MINLHAIHAQIRGVGRGALMGTLIGLLATQSFAATGPSLPSQPSTPSDAVAAGATRTVEKLGISTAQLPAATTESSSAAINSLPQAPEPTETASVREPSGFNPIISEAGQDGQALTSTSTSTKSHGLVRPGFLVMGIVGAAAAGMGAYIFSIKASNTSARNALGTMFLAPGAAAAGIGFYFAFAPKKK